MSLAHWLCEWFGSLTALDLHLIKKIKKKKKHNNNTLLAEWSNLLTDATKIDKTVTFLTVQHVYVHVYYDIYYIFDTYILNSL